MARTVAWLYAGAQLAYCFGIFDNQERPTRSEITRRRDDLRNMRLSSLHNKISRAASSIVQVKQLGNTTLQNPRSEIGDGAHDV